MSNRFSFRSKLLALTLTALPAAAAAQGLVNSSEQALQAPAPVPAPSAANMPVAGTPMAPDIAAPAAPPGPNDIVAPEMASPPPPAAAPTEAAAPPSAITDDVTTGQATTGVVALVNDYVISDYDLNQRVTLFAATSGAQVTKDTLPEIRDQVLRSMEDEILELQEAKKHKISVTTADVDKALKNIADDNHVSLDQIVATVTRAGVQIDTFRQQIAAQLTWQRLVSARYSDDILISDQELDEAMGRLKKGADKAQFEVEEIFLAVDKPEDDMSIHASADQMVKQINLGASFGSVANQFSQSPSAADGGQIGWIVQGQLPEDLDHALSGLTPGQIAGPIKAEGGYYILMLRDRREPIGTVAPPPPTPAAVVTDPDTPVPLDRLLIPLPKNAPDDLKQRAMALANNVRNRATSCADLAGIAAQVPGTVYAQLGAVNPKDLAQGLRDALAKSQPGEVVPPFFDEVGLEVFMRCDPSNKQKQIQTVQLPTRDQLQQQLFVQQMSVYAKSYLRDLRRDAVVEIR